MSTCGDGPIGEELVKRNAQTYGDGDGELALVLDCSDLVEASRFWTTLLGYVAADDATGPYRSLLPHDGRGIELLLQCVPEEKRVKNRLHLDLRTRDLRAEVRRAVEAGAVVLSHEPVREDGWTWMVLADPDGNEFCVIQPSEDYWTSGRSSEDQPDS